jgi:hypothetical protein
MVMIANSLGTDVGYLAARHEGRVGHLYSPGDQRGPYRYPGRSASEYLPYAFDNGEFICWQRGIAWNEEKWKRLLLWGASKADVGQPPLWALVRDKVADRDETLRRWERYAPLVRSYGHRPAFAVQNGMDFGDVPDSDCMLFLGGDDTFKNAAIEPWCARFPGRVHVGRVNDKKRLHHCLAAGAASVDGTGYGRNNARAKRTGSDTALVMLARFFDETRSEVL